MKKLLTCGPLDVLLDQGLPQGSVHGGRLDLGVVPPVRPVHGSGGEIERDDMKPEKKTKNNSSHTVRSAIT